VKTLSSDITNLKNQLAVSGAWLTIMGIYYPQIDSPTVAWQYVNDNSDLTIGSELGPGEYSKWFKAAFQVQQISEEVGMSLPKITVTIYEPETIPEYTVNLKDALQLYDGLSGGIVILRRVYKSIAGVVTDVGIRQEFTILDVSMADTVISLSIGIADPLARRFPRDNYGALTCRHKFMGGFCRYIDNLIRNSGFEDGSQYAPTYWVKWGQPLIYSKRETPVKYGTYSLHIRSLTGVYAESHNQGAQQTFTVKPNTAYTFSCWIYMLNVYTATATIRIMTRADGLPYSIAYADKTILNQWQQVSVTFTTAASQTTATIWLGGIGEAYFDGVSFVPLISVCTHTLEDAPDGTPGCRSHNNSHQFGGSPNAAEGIFYSR